MTDDKEISGKSVKKPNDKEIQCDCYHGMDADSRGEFFNCKKCGSAGIKNSNCQRHKYQQLKGS